ncbi:MAG: DUF4058 family protein [Planctomycetota bacterium]
MPMHDWTRVEAGIFHAFHHDWLTEISRTLNRGLLPTEYYSLPEQVTGRFGPDVLTLQVGDNSDGLNGHDDSGGGTALMARPRTRFVMESEEAFYVRRQKSIVIRHVSGDRVVAVIEIVSPGNKSGLQPFRDFVNKACQLLERSIHLLIVDPFPPTPRDPKGVHTAIWEFIQDAPFSPPADEPLIFSSYECDIVTRAYLETTAVGKPLPEMPLFLEPGGCVMVPLEETYTTTFEAMPRRWRSVLVAD